MRKQRTVAINAIWLYLRILIFLKIAKVVSWSSWTTCTSTRLNPPIIIHSKRVSNTVVTYSTTFKLFISPIIYFIFSNVHFCGKMSSKTRTGTQKMVQRKRVMWEQPNFDLSIIVCIENTTINATEQPTDIAGAIKMSFLLSMYHLPPSSYLSSLQRKYPQPSIYTLLIYYNQTLQSAAVKYL